MHNEDCFHLGIKGLIQDKVGNILLLKVNIKELKKYSGDSYWDIPGGRLQIGDNIESAIRREIKEETGITKINSLTFFSAVLSNIRIPVENSTVGLILFTYLCFVEKSTSITISNEHTEYGWYTPKDAAKLLEVKYPPEFTEKLQII